MVDALSKTPFWSSPASEALLEETRSNCVPQECNNRRSFDVCPKHVNDHRHIFWRHCDAHGVPIHIQVSGPPPLFAVTDIAQHSE